MIDGEFVLRYETEYSRDGLPAGEGAFLACSFWLVHNYILQGRYAESLKLFARFLARCNDVVPCPVRKDSRDIPNPVPQFSVIRRRTLKRLQVSEPGSCLISCMRGRNDVEGQAICTVSLC